MPPLSLSRLVFKRFADDWPLLASIFAGILIATTLAAETGIPLPTAQKLVSRLSGAGLLESSRGTGGGVRLSRPPATITLADVVEAVEGPIALTACVEGQDCTIGQDCSLRPHWPVINGALRGALAGIPLTQLADAPAPHAPKTHAPKELA